MKTSKIIYLSLITLSLCTSCTPGILECFLKFENHEKSYSFNFSKEKLKAQIVESYTYDKSSLSKSFGLTLIENEQVNKDYRKTKDIWLNKKNWNDFKSNISKNTSDTLNLIIGRQLSRKRIFLKVIVGGNDKKSTLTIQEMKYQKRKSCDKEKEHYQLKIVEKIERKLIRKLK